MAMATATSSGFLPFSLGAISPVATETSSGYRLTEASSSSSSFILPTASFESPQNGRLGLRKSGLAIRKAQSELFHHAQCISHVRSWPSTAVICAAALNARCSAEQTQTVTRQSSTITIAPIQGKEKSPDLDDGGTGLPPRDDDGGGGGGGGGGPSWSGGFFFFGFLALLGLLKDKESEGPYRNEKRRY